MYAESNLTNEFILHDYEKIFMVAMFTTRCLYLKAKFEIWLIF